MKKNYMFKQISTREHIQSIQEKRVTIDDFPAIKEAILSKNTFVLVGHNWGDGDSFSSMYALAYLLKGLEKSVKILTDQDIPHCFSFLLDLFHEIEVVRTSDGLYDTGAVIFVDIPHPNEIDRGFNKEHFSPSTTFIEFDHHVGPGNVRLFNKGLAAYDHVSSTAELLFRFLRQHNFDITGDIAICLALGLVSDTSNFRFMTTSRTLEMQTYLKDFLQITFNELFEDISLLDEYEYRLLNHLARSIMRDDNIGCIVLNKSTIEKYLGRRNLSLPTFSMIVNLLGYKIDGIEVIVYFYELSPGKYKVGLRKYPRFQGQLLNEQVDLRVIADHFNGGGHIGAAGFTIELKEGETLEDKIQSVINIAKAIIALQR